MIQRLSHATVYVLDQDRAKAFYTDKLGFEVKQDVSMGAFRWLTVASKAQPELELILMPVLASPMLDETSASTIRELVAKGSFGVGVLETDDCHRTFTELKAKGVQFAREPEVRPYGIEAMMKDDSGNWFSLVQRPG